MDTVYYCLNARKVKVSGGPDLVKFVPAPVSAPAGEVLDFQRCRRKLETRAALEQMERMTVSSQPEEDIPSLQLRSGRPSRVSGLLELAASAAVILVSLAAAAAFLSLI